MHTLKTQIHIGTDQLRPIDSVMNEGWVKPNGGFWTSSYLGEQALSSWAEFCRTEELDYLGDGKSILLNPAPDARIYTIDSYGDLAALFKEYKNPEGLDFMPSLDFEELSTVYDAIHLTENGQRATRLTQPYNLYGWDVECTLWFREKFTVIATLERFTIKGGIHS